MEYFPLILCGLGLVVALGVLLVVRRVIGQGGEELRECERCGGKFPHYEIATRPSCDFQFLCDNCYDTVLDRECDVCGTHPVIGPIFRTEKGCVCKNCR